MKDTFFSGDNVSRLIELVQRDLHQRNIKLDDSYVHTILVQKMTTLFSGLNRLKMNPNKTEFYLKQLCEKSIKHTLQDILHNKNNQIYTERTNNNTVTTETPRVESEFDDGDFTLDDQFSSNDSIQKMASQYEMIENSSTMSFEEKYKKMQSERDSGFSEPERPADFKHASPLYENHKPPFIEKPITDFTQNIQLNNTKTAPDSFQKKNNLNIDSLRVDLENNEKKIMSIMTQSIDKFRNLKKKMMDSIVDEKCFINSEDFRDPLSNNYSFSLGKNILIKHFYFVNMVFPDTKYNFYDSQITVNGTDIRIPKGLYTPESMTELLRRHLDVRYDSLSQRFVLEGSDEIEESFAAKKLGLCDTKTTADFGLIQYVDFYINDIFAEKISINNIFFPFKIEFSESVSSQNLKFSFFEPNSTIPYQFSNSHQIEFLVLS
jgi:hypothetical protein